MGPIAKQWEGEVVFRKGAMLPRRRRSPPHPPALRAGPSLSPAMTRAERAFEVEKSSYAAGWTFIQWRAISSRVATQTLGLEAT